MLKLRRSRSLLKINTPLTVPTITIWSPLSGVIEFACCIVVSTTRRLLSDSRQVFGEAIECAAPSASVRIARGSRFEDRVVQGELGLAANILEQQRHSGFGARRISVRIGPAPDHDQPLRRYHFAIHTLRPLFVVYGPAHVDAICAAGTPIDVERGAGDA